MRKRTFIGVTVVALAVVIMAGGLLASNMGFKLNYQLEQAVVSTNLDGTSTLALPDNRQSNVNSGRTLMNDIGSTAVFSVHKWLKASNTFPAYTGRLNTPAPDFALNAGEGVFVRMKTTTNYIAVGSDDPAVSYLLEQAVVSTNLDGTNLFAYNYHQTAANGRQLMNDIGSTQVFSVHQWLKASNAIAFYTGRLNTTAPDFGLVPGQAYFVRMKTTANYNPSHY